MNASPCPSASRSRWPRLGPRPNQAAGAPKNRWLHVGAMGLVVAAGCGLMGCHQPPPAAAPAPPVVSVLPPVARVVVERDEYTGRLESPETVEIRARVSGYLEKVHFKEGKEVKKGDLLFTIDRRPYQAEYDSADAGHQRAGSQAELAKNDAARAQRLI